MTRTVVDLFGGGGGAGLGYRWAGFDRVIGVDVLDFRDLYEERGRVGEFHKMRWEEGLEKFAAEADLIHASPPCFPAGTPVVTGRGVIAIEEVTTRDVVLTHAGRWRPVTATMNREAEVWQSGWLAATADHPFLARKRTCSRYPVKLSEPEWVPAAETAGARLLLSSSAGSLPVPAIPGGVEMGDAFWYMVGRWLGDGWVRLKEPTGVPPAAPPKSSLVPQLCRMCGQPAARSSRWAHLWTSYCGRACRDRYQRRNRVRTRAEVLICCSFEEAEDLASSLGATGMRWHRTRQRTTIRFAVGSVSLVHWLTENFGKYAHGKTIPGWLLGAPEVVRKNVLAGYLSADAGVTVSPNLAVGIRLLAASLGYATSMFLNKTKPSTMIEGRTVRQRPFWTVTVKEPNRLMQPSDDGAWWILWRKPWEPRGTERVYDLTVEEDHSFTAWGFAVHNCHRYSQMTKSRPGLAETKPDYVAAVREALKATGKPWVIENVAGAPLVNPVMLCCWSFGYRTYRHRLFETSHPVRPKEHLPHVVRGSRSGHWEPGTFISVAGHCDPIAEARRVMAINWMPRDVLVEAIPPYMTEYIGKEMRVSAGIR